MTPDAMVPAALMEALRRQCSPDEPLRWHGCPSPRRIGIETFLLLAFLWAIGLYVLATEPPAALIEPGFGMAELAVGAVIVAGLWISIRQIQNWLNLYRTIYGITPARLVIVRAGWNAEVQSINLATVRRFTLSRKSARRATIRVTIGTVRQSDDEYGPKLDYVDLVGLSDGERAFSLLAR